MLSLSELVAEPIDADRPRPAPVVRSEVRARIEHGRFRDQIVTELYGETGLQCGLTYATIDISALNQGSAKIAAGGNEMVNLSALTVTDAKGFSARKGRASRITPEEMEWAKAQVNLSFEAGKAKQIRVTGAVETYQTKPRDGGTAQTGERLTGDAGEIAKLLRAAADELGYGLSVDTLRNGDRVSAIQYLAQTRRKYSARKPADAETPAS